MDANPAFDAHAIAAATIARALVATDPQHRRDLLTGFLQVAAAGICIEVGPAAAAEQAYGLADHIVSRVTA